MSRFDVHGLELILRLPCRFVSASVAASAQLAYVDSTTKHAIIKVDSTSTVPYNQKRNTVRISSNDRYNVGSVWTTDLYHVP